MLKKKILIIVEDNEFFRSISIILKKIGLDVMGVENNKKAIELLINSSGNNGENVDLILVDLKYPGISEIEFIDTLKKNKIDIPFGVLAEYDTNRLRAILKSRKCKFCLEKPINSAELSRCVSDAIVSGMSKAVN